MTRRWIVAALVLALPALDICCGGDAFVTGAAGNTDLDASAGSGGNSGSGGSGWGGFIPDGEAGASGMGGDGGSSGSGGIAGAGGNAGTGGKPGEGGTAGQGGISPSGGSAGAGAKGGSNVGGAYVDGGPGDPCLGKPNGDFCGGTVQFGGLKGWLYTCANGVTTHQEKCQTSCHVSAPGEKELLRRARLLGVSERLLRPRFLLLQDLRDKLVLCRGWNRSLGTILRDRCRLLQRGLR